MFRKQNEKYAARKHAEGPFQLLDEFASEAEADAEYREQVQKLADLVRPGAIAVQNDGRPFGANYAAAYHALRQNPELSSLDDDELKVFVAQAFLQLARDGSLVPDEVWREYV